MEMPINDITTIKGPEATLRIPYDSPKQAEIVYKVLSVDKEPRRNFVSKELKLIDNIVEVHFVADQTKNLRTSITSFFESALLCAETIKGFGQDAGAHAGTNST